MYELFARGILSESCLETHQLMWRLPTGLAGSRVECLGWLVGSHSLAASVLHALLHFAARLSQGRIASRQVTIQDSEWREETHSCCLKLSIVCRDVSHGTK